MNKQTHYQTLHVTPSAPQSVIRNSYLGLAERYHPDKAAPQYTAGGRYHDKHYAEGDNTRADCRICAATERFAEITAAYAVLKDPARRKRYDAELALLGKPCPRCKGRGTVIKTGKGFRPIPAPCADCDGSGQQPNAQTAAQRVIQL